MNDQAPGYKDPPHSAGGYTVPDRRLEVISLCFVTIAGDLSGMLLSNSISGDITGFLS